MRNGFALLGIILVFAIIGAFSLIGYVFFHKTHTLNTANPPAAVSPASFLPPSVFPSLSPTVTPVPSNSPLTYRYGVDIQLDSHNIESNNLKQLALSQQIGARVIRIGVSRLLLEQYGKGKIASWYINQLDD